MSIRFCNFSFLAMNNIIYLNITCWGKVGIHFLCISYRRAAHRIFGGWSKSPIRFYMPLNTEQRSAAWGGSHLRYFANIGSIIHTKFLGEYATCPLTTLLNYNMYIVYDNRTLILVYNTILRVLKCFVFHHTVQVMDSIAPRKYGTLIWLANFL